MYWLVIPDLEYNLKKKGSCQFWEFVHKKTMESPLMRSTKVVNSIKEQVESKTKEKYMFGKIELDKLEKEKTNQMVAGKLKPKTCMFVCKILVPVTSLIFFITFFIVISVNK